MSAGNRVPRFSLLPVSLRRDGSGENPGNKAHFSQRAAAILVSHVDVLGGSSRVLVPRTGSGGGDEPNERLSRRLLRIDTIQ